MSQKVYLMQKDVTALFSYNFLVANTFKYNFFCLAAIRNLRQTILS